MGQAAGWYRDPFHREQERYWDGHVWTQGTRPAGGDGDVAAATTTTDEGHEGGRTGRTEPSDPGDPGDPGDAADHADAPRTPPGAAPAPGSASRPVSWTPSFAPLGAPVRPAVTAPAAGQATPDLGHGGAHRRRHRRRAPFVVSAAAVVLLVAGLSAVFAIGGGVGTSGEASAAEAVDTAVTQTINANSADVSMSMSASTTGLQESLTGSGAFDFAQKSGTMTMTIPVDGQQYSEQEILDNSTIYVNISGLDTGLAPSVPWVSIPAESDNSPTDISTLDATALLHQLQSAGGSVTSIGQTFYDSTEVTEYETTLPASALESSMGALPSSAGKELGLDLPDMTIDVYVTADKLLKAVVVPSYSFDIAGTTLSMSMTVSFSNYGTPVNVTPPPADQVMPFQQFLGSLGNSGSTGNTGGTGSSGNSGNSGNSGCGCSNV